MKLFRTMWSAMKAAGKRGLDMVLPENVECLCCRTMIPARENAYALCKSCRSRMERMRLPEAERREKGVTSLWIHRSCPRDLVLKLKYSGEKQAGAVLASEMARACAEMSLPEDTVVTWVTMPSVRRRRRNVDHGYYLASQVARQLKLPCRQLLLRRHTFRLHTQQGLSPEERKKNLVGKFAAGEQIPRSVLLVDDVMTTGTTIFTCRDTLQEAGCEQFFAVTATRAVQ